VQNNIDLFYNIVDSIKQRARACRKLDFVDDKPMIDCLVKSIRLDELLLVDLIVVIRHDMHYTTGSVDAQPNPLIKINHETSISSAITELDNASPRIDSNFFNNIIHIARFMRTVNGKKPIDATVDSIVRWLYKNNRITPLDLELSPFKSLNRVLFKCVKQTLMDYAYQNSTSNEFGMTDYCSCYFENLNTLTSSTSRLAIIVN